MRRPSLQQARLAGALSLALVLVGCGSAAEPAAELRGDLTLEQARSFDEWPLVYAGERVDGLPLVAILRRDDTARYVSFVYGDCEPTTFDAGCAPPAEVQVWPAGDRNLGSYDSTAPGSQRPERTAIRGSPAAFFDDGTHLEIYAPRATVVVFADTPDRVRAIADALRCVARPPPTAFGRTLDC